MEVKTKYKLYETVWFMYQNKIYSTQIYSIIIKIKNGGDIEITYILAGINVNDITEDKLFTSKEELIKSL